MRTLRNPQGTNEAREERPVNPFSVYISWKSRDAKWIVSQKNQENKELKKALDFMVLDIMFCIKGGDIAAGTDVFSRPHYRETSQAVKVWNKTQNGISVIAEGTVSEIYDTIRDKYKARKCLQAFGYIPASKQLAILDLTGYAIGPFIDLDQDLAENPVITLNLEGVVIAMDAARKKAWGQLHEPVFTTSPNFTPELAQKAEELLSAPEVKAYLDYLEGKARDTNPEQKEGKNMEDPY